MNCANESKSSESATGLTAPNTTEELENKNRKVSASKNVGFLVFITLLQVVRMAELLGLLGYVDYIREERGLGSGGVCYGLSGNCFPASVPRHLNVGHKRRNGSEGQILLVAF